ncbi:MAG: DUF1549 domain-containing protein [Myxococcaceae bacterium]
MTPFRFVVLCAGLWVGSAFAQEVCQMPGTPPVPPNDQISDTRLLRRVWLALTGTTPPMSRYEAFVAMPADQRAAALDAEVDTLLGDTKFYEQMIKFGHEWIAVPAYTKGAQGDAYQGDMSGHLFRCGGSTMHPNALYSVNENGSPAAQCDSTTVEVNSVEPWWAPGTTVTVLGKAGTATATVVDGMGKTQDCGVVQGGYYDPEIRAGCGCGPNLVWCAPLVGLNSSSNYDLFNNQRRHPFEEPARLFAHLAWNDRPLSDLVVGNYSVGTNWLRALYVRQGRQQGATDVTTNWWKASADASPRDPLHPTPEDPQAWREFTVQDLNPYLLSRRDYQYDPRTTTQPPDGLPAAGVLTMMGPLSAWPRERVRAARFLEVFACSQFNPPPAGVNFPPYVNDPATGGTCMHCHRTLDPAAIFFKRWDFGGDSYYVPWPFMPGLGRFRIDAAWVSGQYPHSAADNDPGFRWRNAFVPGTVMTPTTTAQATANTEALLLDTMPPDYTLLGTHADGTMGPLGFGKLLLASGAFDRCAVRRIYARVVGRELDPTAESGYLDVLSREFVTRERKLKPFIKYLLTQPEFRRGL